MITATSIALVITACTVGVTTNDKKIQAAINKGYILTARFIQEFRSQWRCSAYKSHKGVKFQSTPLGTLKKSSLSSLTIIAMLRYLLFVCPHHFPLSYCGKW